ncbi:hypothetical protein CTE05_33770 [Cellulomonas terrae]|uniref:Uncharacterized protein n=1 Tax=Cellulomonas terrae TaxID=311234 RepID=A0A511JP73_9CELL|nr:hypothetical protein CTE05_33770 [Cellulomonas terrae]
MWVSTPRSADVGVASGSAWVNACRGTSRRGGVRTAAGVTEDGPEQGATPVASDPVQHRGDRVDGELRRSDPQTADLRPGEKARLSADVVGLGQWL